MELGKDKDWGKLSGETMPELNSEGVRCRQGVGGGEGPGQTEQTMHSPQSKGSHAKEPKWFGRAGQGAQGEEWWNLAFGFVRDKC